MKYTEQWSFELVRSCSFFHAAYDKEWKTFNSIVYSYDGDSTTSSECSPSKLVPGSGQPFNVAVKALGYSGQVP